MELGGWWRAVEADDALRRVFPDPDLDDATWPELAVPGHWQSAAPFAGSNGPLLYRRRFESHLTNGQRAWLDLDGLFYQGDVWLDGSYLGDTEGYFFPHHFEITELIRDRTEHLLAVEVACPRPSDKRAKRNLTGVFQHWDCFDQDWNPGGIWRPVHLTPTGSVRLSRLRVLCREATAEGATLDLRPELWWPHALGDQALYNVTVSVACQGEQTDARTVTTGLRQVRMKNFITTVNHERLYLKGANQGPSRRALGEATADDLEHDVRLAREAGLDLLRIHGHISRTELYSAADRHGLLLWQDMPLQWGYSGLRRQAARQATQAVDLLGHHPSIAMWCGHNEP